MKKTSKEHLKNCYIDHKREGDAQICHSMKYTVESSIVLYETQARAVQTMNNAIHRINHYPGDKHWEINCAIQWIKIYPVDSVIHL